MCVSCLVVSDSLRPHESQQYVKLNKLELMCGASLIAQLVKNSPAMQETPSQSLGWEDPLEKGQATHSSILAWRIRRVGHE